MYPYSVSLQIRNWQKPSDQVGRFLFCNSIRFLAQISEIQAGNLSFCAIAECKPEPMFQFCRISYWFATDFEYQLQFSISCSRFWSTSFWVSVSTELKVPNSSRPVEHASEYQLQVHSLCQQTLSISSSRFWSTTFWVTISTELKIPNNSRPVEHVSEY